MSELKAQASNSRAQVLADRAAALLFFVALGSGIVTLAVWIVRDAAIRLSGIMSIISGA